MNQIHRCTDYTRRLIECSERLRATCAILAWVQDPALAGLSAVMAVALRVAAG